MLIYVRCPRTRGCSMIPICENDGGNLLMFMTALWWSIPNVLENVKMQVLKTKIKKIIARKIGVNLGFEL